MRGAAQRPPHLVRDAPPLKPGLKRRGPAPFRWETCMQTQRKRAMSDTSVCRCGSFHLSEIVSFVSIDRPVADVQTCAGAGHRAETGGEKSS